VVRLDQVDDKLLVPEAFVCVDAGVLERPYDRRFIYSAFVDPNGGASDSFMMAIAHMEGKTIVLDVLRGLRAPGCGRTILPPAQAVFDQHGARRSLWWRVATRAIFKARHNL
jgi:hypothetical protein